MVSGPILRSHIEKQQKAFRGLNSGSYKQVERCIFTPDLVRQRSGSPIKQQQSTKTAKSISREEYADRYADSMTHVIHTS